jgi:hypothetical protein
MMLGGGGGKLGGIGPGDEVSYTMRFCASINDGGHRRRTTAMGPHSRLLSIQQSANILCDRLVLLKLKKNYHVNVY